MNSFHELFEAVQTYCKDRSAQVTYNMFIAGIEPVSFEGSEAVLRIRSDFIKNIVETRYLDMLSDAFKEILGFDVSIRFIVPEETVPEPEVATGKYDFTFETFIVGSNNKFAHAAAQAVAANPSGAYNPLFIWGDSGLGKTHLLSAIESEVLKSHPDFNIVYVDGETFTNEIISAIQHNKTSEFRNKYRPADILLVDDVQFIGGKDSTQEEFFHTFNALYNAGKQIVLTSDRAPKEIKSLEDRLRTRFEMGLIADIQAPDFETRVAIVRRKAGLLGLDLTDEVSEYIATRLKTNIRQLEGAVKKLKAYQTLEGIQPVIGAAQNAIKDILSETQPVPVTIDKIVAEVSRTYNTTAEMIRGTSRRANISAARKTTMYIVREITGMSMEEIGNEFGGRDHSTVVYAINDVQEKLGTDHRLREIIEDIMKNVRV